MKIEELKHITIERQIPIADRIKSDWYYSMERRRFFVKNGYVPVMNCMADSYSIISKALDKDCVVAYVTDNSQTTFLIKTSRQFVGFISLSDRLSKYLVSNSTPKITRLKTWRDNKDGFMNVTKDENLVIIDEELWGKYIKTKLLEGLGDE